ncbi:MAG: hypothetical protein Q9217_003149 [Psora testacea]
MDTPWSTSKTIAVLVGPSNPHNEKKLCPSHLSEDGSWKRNGLTAPPKSETFEELRRTRSSL